MRFDGNPGNPGDGRWLSPDPATDLHHDHFTVYLAVLNQQLTAARAGALAPSWRDTLATQPPPALPKRNPPKRNPLAALVRDTVADRTTATCLIYAKPAPAQPPDAGELLACTRRDLAAMPIAAWEPYATVGDWEAALRSWLDTALAVNRHQEALAHRNAIRHQHDGSMSYVREDDYEAERDLLAASASAAAASVTDEHPNLWRSVLAERSRTWDDQDRAAACRLALLDFDTPWAPPGRDPGDPYGGAFRVPALPGPIPEYWTAPRPTQFSA